MDKKNKLFELLDTLNYQQFIKVSRVLISIINKSSLLKEEVSPQLRYVVDKCFELFDPVTDYKELEKYILLRINIEDSNSATVAKELLDNLL